MGMEMTMRVIRVACSSSRNSRNIANIPDYMRLNMQDYKYREFKNKPLLVKWSIILNSIRFHVFSRNMTDRD